MSTDAERDRAASRPRAVFALSLGLIGLLATALAACGAATSQPSAAAAATSCTLISATLSDGPDPGSDLIGYAEAQIRPLRALSLPDGALRTAVGHLADAYAAVFASNDSSAAASHSLSEAVATLNKLCPDSGAGT
jgi:hypothetical protein